jgi:hypothetical protein
MRRLTIFSLLIAFAALAGCTTIPTGPSVMCLPGTGKSFDQFHIDDASCRQFAYEQVGGVTAQQAGQTAAVTGAVVGTALGAAAGAAIGGGEGAAIGAGSGLIAGSVLGAGYASGSYYEAQRRYDDAYLQCMYAKGNRIPVYGQFTTPAPSEQTMSPPPHPPPATYPPPPPPPQ